MARIDLDRGGASGGTGPEGKEGKEGKEGPAGATGPKGEYTNTGAWSAKAIRTKGDAVTRNGSSWACIKSVTLAEDAEPGTAPTIWQLIAEKGATGAEGPKGTTGEKGANGAEGATGPKGEYTNRGPWVAKAARTKGDTTTRNGSTWACIKTVSEGEDKEPGTAPTIWEVMAEKGATGATGESLKPIEMHAFAVNGTLVAEELPGIDVIAPGVEKKLLRLDLRLLEGTSVEVELKRLVKGEGAAELLKKIEVKKGTPVYEELTTTLNDKDYIFIVLTSLVGTPKKLSYTFGIKQFT